MANPIHGRSSQGYFLTWFKRQQEGRAQNAGVGPPLYNIILNIKITDEPSKARGDAIRQRVFHFITQNPVLQFQTGPGMPPIPYQLVWNTPYEQTSAYYATVSPFTHAVLIPTLKLWLAQIHANVAQQGEQWQISFLLSQPLEHGDQ